MSTKDRSPAVHETEDVHQSSNSRRDTSGSARQTAAYSTMRTAMTDLS